jgi:AraC family transcriptional activator of pyochelin receptor
MQKTPPLKMPKTLNSAWDCVNLWDRVFPTTGQHTVLPSSVEVMFVDFSNVAPLQIEYSITRSPLIFTFCLAGTGRGHISHAQCDPCTFTVEPGKASVFYAPGGVFRSEMPGRQHFRTVSIYVPPDWLRQLFGEEQDLAPLELRTALEGTDQKPCALLTEMTTHTRIILNQIYTCPYHGIYRRLFLKNKCMELIIRQLYDISQKEYPKKDAGIPASDIERIHEARKILTNNLDNPPTLYELGRQVGINTNKLSRGFRQLFGATVHTLLRQERLNRARMLLEEDRLSIAEISHQLGFSNASHFVREFSRQCGTTPGRFARAFRH